MPVRDYRPCSLSAAQSLAHAKGITLNPNKPLRRSIVSIHRSISISSRNYEAQHRVPRKANGQIDGPRLRLESAIREAKELPSYRCIRGCQCVE